MARVPTQDVPDVAAQELPGVQYRAPFRLMQMADIAPGEEMRAGAALEQAGTAGGRELALQQADINEAKVKSAVAQYTQGTDTLMNDPQTGFRFQNGQSAVDAHPKVVQAMTDMQQGMLDGLDNDVQRRMFLQASTQTLVGLTRQADEHAGQQLQRATMDASRARASSSSDAAINAYNPIAGADNTVFAQNLAAQHVELEQQADRLGLTGDAKAQYVQLGPDGKSGLAATFAGVVNHLLSNDQAKAAQAFLGGLTPDQLPVAVRDKLGELVAAGGTKDDALALALKVKGQTTDIGEQEKVLDGMFTKGDVGADVHDMALQKLRADNAQLRGEQAENDKRVLGQVWDMKQQNPNATLADLPAGTLAYIKTRGLGPHADAILDRDSPAVDDARLYNDMAHMAVEDPGNFSKLDLVGMRAQLSKPHFDALQRAQLGIDKGDVKQQDADKLVHQTITDLKANILAAGFNLNPKPDTPEASALAQFESSLRDSLVAAQQAGHAPLTRDQARSIALGQMKDEALAGSGLFGTGWMLTHKPVWQMTEEERAAPWKVPEADRTQIAASLQKAGLPLTEEAIQRVYKLGRGVR